MKQFLIFLQGAIKMLAFFAVLITCIGAITTGQGFLIASSLISLVAIGFQVYKATRGKLNEKNVNI